MAIIAQYSRLSNHTILDGLTFSIPSQEDFTISGSGSWTKYDLALSEIGVDELGNKAYIRIGNSINEFVFSTSTQSIGLDFINFTASTTNATPNNVLSLSSDNDTVTWFEIHTTALKDDLSEAYYGKLSGAYKNVGGTYSLLSTVDKIEKTDFATATVNITDTGGSIDFIITGESATNINWKGKIIIPTN
jgi:hypothetical protein